MAPPKWTKQGEFMQFEKLDNDNESVAVLALAYRFKDRDSDPWTARFRRFKFGNAAEKDEAVDGAVAALAHAFGSIDMAKDLAIVAAISAEGETLSDSSQLARVGVRLARMKDWHWAPDALRKRVTRPLKELSGAAERDAEIHGAYVAGSIRSKNILILDDFATRGSTIAEIARAIRVRNPDASIGAVILGKNEKVEFWQERGIVVDNAHVSADLANTWDCGF